MRPYIFESKLHLGDKEDADVVPRALGIGRFVDGKLTLKDLQDQSPEPLTEPLSHQESLLVVTGLHRAAEEFNFAGNNFIESKVAGTWGIDTATAAKFLADIARQGIEHVCNPVVF